MIICSYDYRYFHLSFSFLFINSNTAFIIAFMPVLIVASGKGAKYGECKPGKGLSTFLPSAYSSVNHLIYMFTKKITNFANGLLAFWNVPGKVMPHMPHTIPHFQPCFSSQVYRILNVGSLQGYPSNDFDNMCLTNKYITLLRRLAIFYDRSLFFYHILSLAHCHVIILLIKEHR